ncbi:hypothetical protein CBS101457_002988 [Exobasidium rhododendri]|nr:hypothetical protein CBS101457_002988 [Exobasidium rhododendri]
MKGYLHGEQVDEEEGTFVHREGTLRWFPTGDYGYMTEDGDLVVLSRMDDIIIKGGKNIDPTTLEAIASRLVGVDTYAVGIPSDTYGQDIALVIQPAQDTDWTLDDKMKERIRGEITSQLSPLFRPAIILVVGGGQDPHL